MTITLAQAGVRSFKAMENWVAFVDVKGELFLIHVDGTRNTRVAQDVIDYQFSRGAIVFLTINGSLQADPLDG